MWRARRASDPGEGATAARVDETSWTSRGQRARNVSVHHSTTHSLPTQAISSASEDLSSEEDHRQRRVGSSVGACDSLVAEISCFRHLAVDGPCWGPYTPFIGGGQRVLRDLAGRFAGHLGDLADG